MATKNAKKTSETAPKKQVPARAVTFGRHSYVPEFCTSLDWYLWNDLEQTLGQHKTDMEGWADGLYSVNTRTDSTLSEEDANAIGMPSEEAGKEVEELIDDLSDHLGQLDHYIEMLRSEGIDDPESLTAGQILTAKIQHCFCEAIEGVWKSSGRDQLAVLKATVAWVGAEASWQDFKAAINSVGLKGWKWEAFNKAPLDSKLRKFESERRKTLGEYNHTLPHNAGPQIGQALQFKTSSND